MRTMSRMNKHFLPILFLVVPCLLVYSSSLNHEFIPFLDDTAYIICNGSIRGFSFENIKIAFTSCYVGNYAPMHIVSYMIDYWISGLKPSGIILSNVLLHTSNGLLFYYLLIRSKFTPTGAFAAALIFLLHPVQVESVVWASERKTVLSMMFFLLAIHSYLNYRSEAGKANKTGNYLFSLFLYTLAVLSKPVVVILPVFLVIHDLTYRKMDRHWNWLKDKSPYILIACIGAVITMYTQDPSRAGGRTGFHGGSGLATFFTMLPVLSKYLRLVFYPTGLSIFYGDVPVRTSFDEEVFQACLVAIALLALGIWLFRKYREPFCWYAMFFVGLLPVCQIVPIITLMNDRYLYFPMLGGAAFIATAISSLNAKFVRYRCVVPALSFILFLVMSLLTYNQTKTWQNPLSVLRQVVNSNNEAIEAKLLQDVYFSSSDPKGLMEVTETLVSRFPNNPDVLRFAGSVYDRAGGTLLARHYFDKAVSLDPLAPGGARPFTNRL